MSCENGRCIKFVQTTKCTFWTSIRFEPEHSISYKIAYEPCEDFDTPAHLFRPINDFARHSVGSQDSKVSSSWQQSELIKVFAGHSVGSKIPKCLQVNSEDTDLRRLVKVFAVHSVRSLDSKLSSSWERRHWKADQSLCRSLSW